MMKNELQIPLQAIYSIFLVNEIFDNYSFDELKNNLSKISFEKLGSVFQQGMPGQGLVAAFFYIVFAYLYEVALNEKKLEENKLNEAGLDKNDITEFNNMLNKVINKIKKDEVKSNPPEYFKGDYVMNIRHSLCHHGMKFHQKKGEEENGFVTFTNNHEGKEVIFSLYLTKCNQLYPPLFKILGRINQKNEL
jgi:hypothetical protein